jgi:hypothetical protein
MMVDTQRDRPYMIPKEGHPTSIPRHQESLVEEAERKKYQLKKNKMITTPYVILKEGHPYPILRNQKTRLKRKRCQLKKKNKVMQMDP